MRNNIWKVLSGFGIPDSLTAMEELVNQFDQIFFVRSKLLSDVLIIETFQLKDDPVDEGG